MPSNMIQFLDLTHPPPPAIDTEFDCMYHILV